MPKLINMIDFSVLMNTKGIIALSLFLDFCIFYETYIYLYLLPLLNMGLILFLNMKLL